MRDTSGRPGSGRRQRAARRSTALVAVLLAGLLGLAACSSSGGGDSSSSKAAAPGVAGDRAGQGTSGGSGLSSAEGGDKAVPTQPTQPTQPGSGAKAAPRPTYMVRTADLSVRTRHVADALERAKEYADRAGGYAGDEDTEVDSSGRTTSSVQLRVPPAQYESVLDELAGLGTLLSREVNVKDVTGQVVDVQSRIKSQRASVDRVRKLMDQATDLSEVVSLESELSSREAALESLEAQQASLEGQTDLATVTLRLSEPPAKPAKPAKEHHDGFWTQVGHGLGDGWHGFYLAMRTVLVVLAVLLPFLGLFTLLAWAYRVARRRWFPYREPASAPPAGHSGELPAYPHGGVREPWLAPPVPQVPPQQAPDGGEEPPPAG
jgi:hypothetical protein